MCCCREWLSGGVTTLTFSVVVDLVKQGVSADDGKEPSTIGSNIFRSTDNVRPKSEFVVFGHSFFLRSNHGGDPLSLLIRPSGEYWVGFWLLELATLILAVSDIGKYFIVLC